MMRSVAGLLALLAAVAFLGVPQAAMAAVFGVQPGEAHTQPNANGEVWFTSGFVSAGGGDRQLIYGVPETDGIAFIATCSPGANYKLDLIIAAGNRAANTPVRVEVAFDGRAPIWLEGRTFQDSSEFGGVRLQISALDRFWTWLSTARSVSLGAEGHQKITLPGAGAAGQFFLSQCDRAPSQSAQPAAPPQLSKVFTVTCPNGASFQIQFENSQTASKAILYPGLPQQLILNSIPTGSGAAYQNGPLKIFTKGTSQLTVDSSGNATNCSMR